MVSCQACGHYYTEVAGAVDLEQLYGSGTYTVVDTRGSLTDKIKALDHRIVLRRISKLGGASRSLLDLGCGKGQFLHSAAELGWKVKGIETAVERATFGIEQYGLDISTEEYHSGVIEGGPFGVITVFHVLEHLPRPAELLGQLVAENLARNGYLVIEVPLFGSLQSKLAGKHWVHLDPPLHVSHFTKRSLSKLLSELALEPRRFEYLSVQQGLLGMVQSVMSMFGYRKMIISELKFRRTWRLMLAISLVLPIALVLESLAVALNSGGVLRVYCQKSAQA